MKNENTRDFNHEMNQISFGQSMSSDTLIYKLLLRRINMNWETLINHFPDRWVWFEAIEAHSDNRRRMIDRISLINNYDQSKEALDEYKWVAESEYELGSKS